MIPHQTEINRLHAELCSGLSDPTRISILYALAEGSRCVNELTELLGLPQSTVSRHLRILRISGLVSHRRAGKQVIYALADPRVIQALDLLREVLNSHVLSQSKVLFT